MKRYVLQLPTHLKSLSFTKKHLTTSTVCQKHLSDPENKGTHQTGVNFDTLGSWDNKLALPLHLEQSVKKGTLIPRIGLEHAGKATNKGRRSLNEDRILLAEMNKNLLLLGILDGHGSPMAADFVQEYLKDIISFWLRRGYTKLDVVLRKSFIELNNLMARHIHFYCHSSVQNAGTTATIALLRNSIELVVCHVGDSRAVLCRSGQAHPLSVDDDPGLRSEQQRIRSRGGIVSSNSLGVPVVNGRLGMTRSLGDAELKAYGVVATPHIHTAKIRHGRDAFLVMVTDGVTFVMSNQELVELVCSCREPVEAAYMVVDQALQFGSEDNISVLVVPFGSWGKYAKSGKQPNYTFARNLFSSRFFG